MRTLKNQPLQRWYRIKDGIVYTILTTQPSKEMLQDYKSTSELINYLPYIKITYGFIDASGITNTAVEEKLYLDSLIEPGDKFITKDNSSFFEPYINNSEDTISKGYYTILCSELESEITKLIIKSTAKSKILNVIPDYLKYASGENTITPKNVNSIPVNCIIEIKPTNCLVYNTNNQSYEEQNSYGYVEKYEEFVCKVISNYYTDLMATLCERQEVLNPSITTQISPNYQATKNNFKVTYDIDNTNKETQILGSLFNINQLYCMEVNGKLIKPANKYTFDKTGTTTVTFYIKNDSTSLVSLANLLDCCSKVTSVNFSSLNTSNVKSMYRMLAYTEKLTSIIFQSGSAQPFTTKNVTNMSRMFEGCKNIKSLSVDLFDTSSVKDMSYMFSQCKSLSTLNVSKFKTYNVTNMSRMFHACEALKSIDCSNFNTAKVTNMESMFNLCKSITELNLDFQTALVENMSNMFSWCSNLISVNLTFNSLLKLKSMYCMFNGCTKLNSYKFNFPSNKKIVELPLLETTEQMFQGCSSLTSINLTPWNFNSIKNMHGMFMNCSSLHAVGMWVYGTKPMELDATEIFNGCPKQGAYWYNLKTSVNEYNIDFPDFVWSMKRIERLVTDEALQKEAEKYITEPEEPEVVDNYIVATYNVTQTGNTNVIGVNDDSLGMFSKMVVNNTELDPAKVFTFHQTGEINIKWVLKDGDFNFYQLFSECPLLTKIDFSSVDMTKVTSMLDLLQGCEGVSSVIFKGNINPDAVCDDMFGASMNGTLTYDKIYQTNYAKVIAQANQNDWNINGI